MEIKHSKNCTNVNCVGGVITFNGRTGRLCLKCNPMKNKHGIIVIEWERAEKYDGDYANVDNTPIGSFVRKKGGDIEAWSAMTNKYKTVKTKKAATDFVRDQMLKYVKLHLAACSAEQAEECPAPSKKFSNSTTRLRGK